MNSDNFTVFSYPLAHVFRRFRRKQVVICHLLNMSTSSGLHLPSFLTSDSKSANKNISANAERSFIMIKPDGVQRNLIGKIIGRFEDRGYKIVAMKMVHATTQHLEKRM